MLPLAILIGLDAGFDHPLIEQVEGLIVRLLRQTVAGFKDAPTLLGGFIDPALTVLVDPEGRSSAAMDIRVWLGHMPKGPMSRISKLS